MLKTYLEISLGMSAVILLALSFTPFLKKRYRAGARYAIWIICAVALLVPFKPSPKITIEVPQIKHEAAASPKLTDDVTYVVPKSDEAVLDGIADTDTKSETAYVQPSYVKTAEPIDVWAVLTAVWLLGAAAFMLYYIVGYAVFLKKTRPWCRELEFSGYREKPRLIYCRLVKSPMLTGFFKPRILLPRNDYSDIELSMILKHELTHYKRGDLWAKLLFIAVNSIHWFNPVVYIMRKAANRDMEHSCDERVVKGMDRKFCQDYSIAILRCAAGVGMCTAFSTHFSEDKEKLRQRLKNILSGRKKRGIIIGAIALVLAVTCAGVFGFVRETETQENYLLLGEDSQNHIDTIMLAEVGKNSIYVTSIPRDTLTVKRFTNAVSKENVEQISDAVAELKGVNVDKYIVAYTEDAEELLSKIGSVKFEIPDLYGDGEGMVYDDPYLNLHIALSSGEHELTGAEMLQVMRYRKSNIKNDGKYNAYKEGDLDRIRMTHSLLEEIVKQKKDVFDEKIIIDTARSSILHNWTNIGVNDVKKICKAAKNGRITFELLAGEYEKDANGTYFYIPQYTPAQEGDKSIINRYDTTDLSCEVTSFIIDGEEQLAEENGKIEPLFGLWYNKQAGRFHMIAVAEMKDGNYACVREISVVTYENNSAEGKFRFKTMTKMEAGETLSTEEFTGVITGLDTETPILKSRGGKYIIKFKVINRNEGYAKNPAEDLKERYRAIYGDGENIYAGVGGNFCMPVPDGIEIEEYDLNGGGPNGIEKLWNVSTPYGEFSIKAIDKVLDLPETEEVLKQRFYNIPPWSEDAESAYTADKYTISDFMRFLFCYDADSGDGLLGYCYTVTSPEGGSRFIQEMPISDTKTLRVSAYINTADEDAKQKIIDIARTVRVVKNNSKP